MICKPFDETRRKGAGLPGTLGSFAEYVRLVGEEGDDGSAEVFFEMCVVLVVGESQETGDGLWIEDVTCRRGRGVAAFLLGEGAADVAAAVGVPQAHRLPLTLWDVDAEDRIVTGGQDLHRIRIDAAVLANLTQEGADVAVEEGAAGVGAPEAGIRAFDVSIPEADRLAGKVWILRYNCSSGRTGGIRRLVVENDFHIEVGRLFYHPAHQAEEFVGEIAYPAGETDASVGQNASESGLVEGMELADEFFFIQVVVPEPEGNQAEPAGGIGKKVKRVFQVHRQGFPWRWAEEDYMQG